MRIITICAILGFAAYGIFGAPGWVVVQPQKRFKKKDKFWQIQISKEGVPVIYLIQGGDPTVRVFEKGVPYHHLIPLSPMACVLCLTLLWLNP
ncbi:MAG: hypothetical protein H6925_00795 [Holosporaceae bacterium]|nr:MAG: hypothetical protein H6925_00795 [Holosporaceae bacterium]